jgi:hypothetical protein
LEHSPPQVMKYEIVSYWRFRIYRKQLLQAYACETP